jgi:hypothetical protein
MAYYPLFHAPRLERFMWMMRGVRDGLWAGASGSHVTRTNDDGRPGDKLDA